MKSPKLLPFVLQIVFILVLQVQNAIGNNLALSLTQKVLNLHQTRHCSVLLYESDKNTREGNDIDVYRETRNRDILTLNPKSTNQNETTNSLELYLNPLNKVKKRGANCLVTLFFYNKKHNNNNPGNQEKLEGSLSLFVKMTTLPLSSPLTKRNEDFFVFVVGSPEVAEKILLSSHIAFTFKYKITITNLNNNVQIKTRMHTLCFYRNRGQPQILELNTENENGFFSNMVRNFNGALIKASTTSSGPSTQMRKGKQDGIWRPYKTGGPFLKNLMTIAETLNFTFSIRPSIGGGGSGLKAKNGTWSGLMGDVMYGNVDVGVACGITLDRFFLVEFTSPIEYYTVLFAHGPATPIYTWKSIFRPFAPRLWAATVFSTIISISVLLAIRYFSLNFVLDLKFTTNTSESDKIHARKEIWSLEEILFFLLPSFLAQSFLNARSSSFQVFSACWLLFIIVIMTVYLSKLFGFFVEPPLEKMPTTFDELAESHFQIGMTYYGGAIYSWFKNANKRTAISKIYKRMEKRKTVDCFRDTLAKKNYACISYRTSIEFAVQVKLGDRYGRSPMVAEPAIAFLLPISLLTERRSILAQSINRITRANFEASLPVLWRSWTHTDLRTERLQQEKANNQVTPNMPDSSEPIQLNIKHFTGALTILFCGAFISMLVFVEEMCRSWIAVRYFHKNEEQKENHLMRPGFSSRDKSLILNKMASVGLKHASIDLGTTLTLEVLRQVAVSRETVVVVR